MFNIKNRIYVKHLDTFAPHEGPYILLDGGKYTDTCFDEQRNFLMRYDTFDEMMKIEFHDDIKEFISFLNIHDKFRIYVKDVYEYTKLFNIILCELFETFGGITKKTIKNILDWYELSLYIKESKLVDYKDCIDNSYKPTGELYSKTDIQDIPLDFVMILNKNGLLSDDAVKIKLVPITKNILSDYILSQMEEVITVIINSPTILSNYSTRKIKNISDIKTVIKNSKFLTKILTKKIVDIDSDLDEIVDLLNVVFTFESEHTGERHRKELDTLVNLYRTNDVKSFKDNVEMILSTYYFSKRNSKFNEYIIQQYAQ